MHVVTVTSQPTSCQNSKNLRKSSIAGFFFRRKFSIKVPKFGGKIKLVTVLIQTKKKVAKLQAFAFRSNKMAVKDKITITIRYRSFLRNSFQYYPPPPSKTQVNRKFLFFYLVQITKEEFLEYYRNLGANMNDAHFDLTVRNAWKI